MRNYAKTPTVYQMEAAECGAASLSMIFAYYGKHVPLEQMRVETGVSRDGCSAGNIMRAAKKYGFECHGYRKSPSYLKTVKPPCIIHWNFDHFVVFEGFKGKYAYINDPAAGRRRLAYDELDDCFTGVVLTFAPAPGSKKEKSPNTFFKFIKHMISGQRGSVTKLLFIGFLSVFPVITLPVLSQIFLDDILSGGNTDWFLMLMVFMFSAILLSAGLEFYRDKILVRLQKKMALLSAREFLYKMFRLPISFFEQRYVGDLSARASDSTDASGFLAGDLARTVLDIIPAAACLVLMIIYSPVLTAIAVTAVILDLIIMRLASNAISSGAVRLRQDLGRLAGALCAGISVISTIKASGAETEYTGKILGHSAKVKTLEQRLSRFQRISGAVPDAVNALAYILILPAGGLLVMDGRMTIGMLTAFTALFGMFSSPVEQLVGAVKKIQTAKADIDRVEDVMNYRIDSKFSERSELSELSERSELDERADRTEIKTKLSGAVELRNISFGYSTLKPPIVSDFSFKIGCGSSIALVGASGCGKSTVAKIISGLYEPWEGELLFDGISSKKIPNEILNASVSTVSQEITLFSGTVRDNLTMWNTKISEQDMIAAAKDACIHDVISQKPGAYDFRLSEGGANLSGGQRQRLEIARALATNPTVLIMDEATSALDPVIEKKIMDNIKRRGCTCIVSAHRLSAIRDCGQIIVLSQGRIVQRGTHEELSAAEGHYREFIKNG